MGGDLRCWSSTAILSGSYALNGFGCLNYSRNMGASIRPVANTIEEVKITLGNASVFIEWQSVVAATGGYDLTLFADAARTDKIAVYHFDAQGRYVMSTTNFPAASADEPYTCTIENLQGGTKYYYTLQAFSSENTKINYNEGDFKIGGITNINDASANDMPLPVGYYSISGQKLQQEPESGVYIIKYGNGTTKKVIRNKKIVE